MWSRGLGPEEAVREVRRARPWAVESREQHAAIREFHERVEGAKVVGDARESGPEVAIEAVGQELITALPPHSGPPPTPLTLENLFSWALSE